MFRPWLRSLCRRSLRSVQPRLERLEDRTVPTTAYHVPAGTVGNQNYGGSLGMDFDVNQSIVVTHLGVFDSGSNGLSVPLVARVYNRATQQPVASIPFAAGTTGTLTNGSRFLPLASPLLLPAGFRGTSSARATAPTNSTATRASGRSPA